MLKKDKQTHDKKVLSFTKTWVRIILINCLIWIYLSYLLSALGKDPIEKVTYGVIAILLGTFIPYMVKAFFETYSEENLKYKKELNELGIKDTIPEVINEEDGE